MTETSPVLVLAAYHTAQPSCSALHLAASKRVAHHSPQRKTPCAYGPQPSTDFWLRQGVFRWTRYASHSPELCLYVELASGFPTTASRLPRIPAGNPGVGWITLRLPVMLSFGSTGLPCCSLAYPTTTHCGHWSSSLARRTRADQIGDKANQRDQQRRVGCKNKKRVHEIAHATTNAAANGNTTHQKNISIPVISISRRINPGQS